MGAYRYLTEFNLTSVIVRLILAALAGVIIGYGRSKRDRTGLRTYTLVCIGGAVSMMIGLYMREMLHGPWLEMMQTIGDKTDVTRIPTQTISGIGFLGAGIIFKVAHYQVSGLTTATGLFAAVVIGIAAGAGFYVGVAAALVLVMLVMHVMAPFKNSFRERGLNITFYVEFESIDDVSAISELIESMGAGIFEVDIERAEAVGELKPSAVFDARLSRENRSHSVLLSSVAELPCVSSVQEIIA